MFPIKKDSDSMPVPLVSFIGRAPDCQLLALLARKIFLPAEDWGNLVLLVDFLCHRTCSDKT